MRPSLVIPLSRVSLALVLGGGALAMIAPMTASAQVEQAGKKKDKKEKKKDENGAPEEKKVRASQFFASESLIPTVVLTANYGRLRKDRGDDSPWRWGSLSYTGADGKTVTLPTKVKTRGIWRRKNCSLPPLRLNFEHKDVKGTLFEGQDKPKLVVHCRDSDEEDQYRLKELLAYRIYNQVTPLSHRARLAKVQYVDSASGKPVAQRYAIFLESVDEMAARLHGTILKQQGATPDDIDQDEDALFGMFEYMIGNTDFAVVALHNVELLSRDTSVNAIAHDFDWSGLVDARYAVPDPRVGVKRVRDRVYRGFCVPEPSMMRAVARFNEVKPQIYALLTDSIGALMGKDERNDSRDYFDSFYQTINEPRALKREILEACLGR